MVAISLVRFFFMTVLSLLVSLFKQNKNASMVSETAPALQAA
jgi:hypothetical protein